MFSIFVLLFLKLDLFYTVFFGQIVDFCCGSNEFSCLMKEKLDKVGKCCFFKNYDLFPPKVSLDSFTLLYFFTREMFLFVLPVHSIISFW